MEKGEKTAVTAMVLASAFFSSIPMVSIGVVLPFIRKELMLAESSLGIVAGASSLGLLFTFLSGRLSDKFGRTTILRAGNIIILASTSTIYLIGNSTSLIALLFSLGVGVSFIESSINPIMAEVYCEWRGKAINLVHSVWATGAVIGPTLATTLLSTGQNWRIFYLIFSAMYSIVTGISFVLSRRLRHARARSPKKNVVRGAHTNELKIAELELLILLALAAFLTSGVHAGVASWLPSYLIINEGVSVESAGFTFALFVAFIGIGRFISAFYVDRFGHSFVIFASSALAATSTAVALLMRSTLAVATFWCLAGFFLSPCLPTLVARTNVAFPARAGYTTGILYTSMAVGGFVSTWLIGTLAQSFSLDVGMSTVAVLLTLIVVLQIVERLKRPNLARPDFG